MGCKQVFISLELWMISKGLCLIHNTYCVGSLYGDFVVNAACLNIKGLIFVRI